MFQFVIASIAALAAASVHARSPCAPDLDMIGQVAADTPDLSTLVAAVTAMNLTDVLARPGPVDVFAPTNEAFASLLADFGVTVDELLAERDLVTRVLQYHVVIDGAVCSGELSGDVDTALSGETLTVYGSTVTDANGNTANVVSTVEAGNGVVYVVDKVLLPSPDVEENTETAGQITCPPEGFDAVGADEINIQAYISKPWFIQEQMPLAYQTESQLYCVRAAYKQLEDDLFEVYNYANNDGVNGPPQVTGENFRLVAELEDVDAPSKLSVGIRGLGGRPAFAGPYWIVAIDTSNVDDPQWAIVAGGPPNVESNGKCLYPTEGFNGNGLWLFHREPIAPEADVELMRQTAADLGLDVTALLPVAQDGCLYDGAYDPQA